MYNNNPQLLLSAFLILAGCSVQEMAQDDPYYTSSDYELVNAFSIDLQKSAPRQIQSIRLYRNGSQENPPIIQLGGNDKLILEFDYLGKSARQFRAEITHHNKNWEESPLIPGFYLSGFNKTYFGSGLKNMGQRPPSYFHFRFEIPDPQFSFKVSGNYLLSIYDYDSDELLFSLPFFVTENEGILETHIKQVVARSQDLRRGDQPFSQYFYPDFVEIPQFDLAFLYVQNQFWGRAREVGFFDTSTPGQVHFHLDQDQAFVGDYTFNLLDLSSLNTDGRQILNVEEDHVPPRVILRRDVQNFNPSPGLVSDSGFGFSVDERYASYAEVWFSLETTRDIDSTQNIFLVGDFNNWTIDEYNRMTYNPKSKMWEGRALIKEGQYVYKYIVLRKGEVDDLSLDQSYFPSGQEYITLVYYRDPARNYDRLLKVDRIIGN